MSSDGVYVAIWEFKAKPEFRAEFENFYGPGGEWVQLFRRVRSAPLLRLAAPSSAPGQLCCAEKTP